MEGYEIPAPPPPPVQKVKPSVVIIEKNNSDKAKVYFTLLIKRK